MGSPRVGIQLKRLSMFDRGWSITLKNCITHRNTIMETELRLVTLILISMYIKTIFLIHLHRAVLGLHCYLSFSLFVVCWLLIAVASRVVGTGSQARRLQ